MQPMNHYDHLNDQRPQDSKPLLSCAHKETGFPPIWHRKSFKFCKLRDGGVCATEAQLGGNLDLHQFQMRGILLNDATVVSDTITWSQSATALR